ncbi:HU family DNA-binding protein [Sphingomonas sp. MMSM20]|nr:HU family DNA-binding protein [Sphingomonas lycopersici]
MARNISRAEARAMVADVLDAIVAGAAKGEVALAGFGKFSVTRRPARPGRNPSTGEKIVIPPTNRVAFKAAKAFKDRVAG